jgi:hypothetical protein
VHTGKALVGTKVLLKCMDTQANGLEQRVGDGSGDVGAVLVVDAEGAAWGKQANKIRTPTEPLSKGLVCALLVLPLECQLVISMSPLCEFQQLRI